jgi:hypothetical protein
MKNKVEIIGGGTYSPIYNHLGLCSLAKGGTAVRLWEEFLDTRMKPNLHLSDIAAEGKGEFRTNEDLQNLVNRLKADVETKVIIMTAAVCDYTAGGGSDNAPRPTPGVHDVTLFPAAKIVRSIRDASHKHIFVVAFKQTVGLNPQQMYLKGLALCKEASVNLVLVNDTKSWHNMIVTPEEAAYHSGMEREQILKELVEMTVMRSHLSFTRSTVVSGVPVSWADAEIPESLRAVVNHCIEQRAYKTFNGATVGHFACKLSPTEFLTSIRRSDFNNLHLEGLVRVTTDGPDEVTAYGAKPSVGGQSQRIVFGEHEGMDCIVHFHCPLKDTYRDRIKVMSQRELECGSHECGQNTSNGLRQFGNLKAVMLDNHGPNIVFPKDINPQEVIDFIEANFDLSKKTGGYQL